MAYDRSAIFEKVAGIQADLVRFTQQAIRIPSVTGSEGDFARFVLARLQEMCVDEAWIDGIGNVIGVLHGSGKGPNVMLNSHLDIVPAGRLENWQRDPFGAELDEQGNIHGRGTVDMKAGVASHLFCMKLLKEIRDELGQPLPGDVIFTCVVFEEAAECFGMQYLCEKTLPEKGLTFEVCYLSEPTHGQMVLGHRGKVEIVVTTYGETAHSSSPWLGVNALELMTPVQDYVFHVMPESFQSYPELGKASITITNLICRPGGLSIIPDECEISVDRRYVPGETLESILQEFEAMFTQMKAVDPRFKASVKVRTFHEKSYTGYEADVQKHHAVWVVDVEHPLVQQALQSLRSVGQTPGTGYLKGGTDGSWTTGLLGIPTLIYHCSDDALAHTPVEHVTVDQLVKSTEGYLAILCDLFEL